MKKSLIIIMARLDSEYREFLPETCNLLSAARIILQDQKYDCERNCLDCPAVELIDSKPVESGVKETTGNQFVDRNLGLRKTIIYPGPGD